MIKKKLRDLIISQLKKQLPDHKKQIEKKLVQQLTESELWKQAHTIGITISQAVEWNTKPIIFKAWEQGKTICVPRSHSEKHELTFYIIDSFEQLEIARYGLLEPILDQTIKVENEHIDLMIVPGVVFDTYGFRIGFGGGYYDRFLASFYNETCSLLSTTQLVDQLPIESHDIPVNYLITENNIQKRKILEEEV